MADSRSGSGTCLPGATPPDGSAPPDAPNATAEAAAPALQRVAMLLAYDGSAFQGWQIQQQGDTVQGLLQQALGTALGRPTPVWGSGRTDAGVHAFNQVAHFQAPPDVNLYKLRASLNALAGPHVAVKALTPIAADFHARHSATGKTYRYYLHNRPWPPLFARQRSWWIKWALDLDAMRAAAPALLGEHDFSAFRAADCAARSPVRNLRRLALEDVDAPEGTLCIELEASGFLQHMARILVGTLVMVGEGRLAPEDVADVLASRQRARAGTTAPGCGLHLWRVFYDLERYPELAALETVAGHA